MKKSPKIKSSEEYKAERKKKIQKWVKPRSAAALKQVLRGER